MRFIRIAVLAGLWAAACATGAAAADPNEALLPPAPVVEDTTETWYLRGDVGAVHFRRPEADFAAAFSAGGLVREGIDETAVLGAGIGYRVSPDLRLEAALDHRFAARFKGLGPGLQDRALFQSSTLMLNGYVDLGSVMGVTPYLGAGIGVAHNVLSGYARGFTDPATGLTSWTRLAGDNSYSLAWALMAGVGYEVLPGLTVDLGYRYVALGDLKTRRYGTGAGADVSSIGAHEVRMGVRYALD